jgi:hypothetical protein
MPLPLLSARVRDIVAQWDGVTVQPRRLGGVTFRVQHREFGHLHGNAMVDVPCSIRMRRDLVAAGRARPHHTLPASGWVSHPLRTLHDVPAVVALLKLNYDRLRGVSRPRGVGSVSLLAGRAEVVSDRAADDLPA